MMNEFSYNTNEFFLIRSDGIYKKYRNLQEVYPLIIMYLCFALSANFNINNN